MTFQQKLNNISTKNNSLLCIGLDPDISKFPKRILSQTDPIFTFNKEIIDSTHDLVCAYKPNIAFYESEGIQGLHSLKKTVDYLKTQYSETLIILDAKRADIANTSKNYAKAAFEYWQADAVTVFPHLGEDSLIPFLRYEDKLTIVLIKTSNPDASIFQNLLVSGIPYYLYLAKTVRKWNYVNLGAFVGATYHEELANVRKIMDKTIILTAGLGAQKADYKKTFTSGLDAKKHGAIFNVSRSVLYKSLGDSFAKEARIEAMNVRDEINSYR